MGFMDILVKYKYGLLVHKTAEIYRLHGLTDTSELFLEMGLFLFGGY